MYRLLIGDKSDDLGWTLAYFSKEQNFSTRDVLHTFFCQNTTKFGRVVGLANQNLFPEFRELWSGGPVIPCGDMCQSFTGTRAKWFFDNFLMFSDSFVRVSIQRIARGLGASFLYKYCVPHRTVVPCWHGLLVLIANNYHFMAIIQVNPMLAGTPPQLKTGWFCGSKVLLPMCLCWWQLVHSD